MESLEKKLSVVKSGIVDRFNEKEMTQNDYWRFTHKLVLEEGIVDGSFEDYDSSTFSVKLATNMEHNIGLRESRGVESNYVFMPGVKFSESAQNDIDFYNEIKTELKSYLKIVEGDFSRPFTKSEYSGFVDAYISDNDLIRRELKDEISIRMRIHFERDFDLIEDDEKIGKYSYNQIRDAIKKI